MKKYNPLVSIIVPVYGTESYLSTCIDSILNQEYKNIQIILVDDESPDKCPEICDEYAKKDNRIIVFHQKNKGVSGARNTGLNLANGDFVMFVDSDDELFPKAVETLVDDAYKYEADIVWAPRKRTDIKKDASIGFKENSYTVYKDESSLLLSLDGECNTNAVWGKIFRADFINGMRFEEGKHINEDGFFMFQCYMKKPILIRHDVPIYKYNTRVNSSSRQTFSDKYFSMLYFCKCKKDLVSAHFPQYMDHVYNMEVRTHLFFLQALCHTDDVKYKNSHVESVKIIRELYSYHKPINKHHKKMAWIVYHGLYTFYKKAVRLKYKR